MNRIKQIRDEAKAQEAYWACRRVGAYRIAMKEASDMGMTMAEAAEYCGTSYHYIAARKKRFGLTFMREKARVNQAAVRRVSVDIDVRATCRETALANRGKASAGQIASALGITRNAVIGHWFRARQLGLIQ